VVGEVGRGDVLTAGEAQGDWLAVTPPDTVGVWVFSQLVRDGKASVSPVLVRAGPGINYREVGRLQKGDKVVVKGASASGEWLKIAPPAGCVLWISGKYTEPAAAHPTGESGASKTPRVTTAPPKPPAAGSATAKPKEAAVSSPADGKRKVDLPPGLNAAKLADREGQGKLAQYEGVLGSAGWVWNKPSQYRLIKTDEKGHIVSACYVLGDESRLSPLKGRTLVVYGPEYWLQGVSYPVVSAQQIVPKH
jgi:uncharacterized protein YraI